MKKMEGKLKGVGGWLSALILLGMMMGVEGRLSLNSVPYLMIESPHLNIPNTISVEYAISNVVTKLTWLDNIGTASFDFVATNNQANYTSFIQESAFMTPYQFISRDANSVSKNFTSSPPFNIIRIKSNATVVAKYKLQIGIQTLYGLYVPFDYQVSLIPFDVNQASCDLVFSFTSHHQVYLMKPPLRFYQINMKLYAPGLNPLTDTQTMNLTVPFIRREVIPTSVFKLKVRFPPGSSGRWVAKLPSEFGLQAKTFINPGTLVIEAMRTDCNACIPKCPLPLQYGQNVLDQPCPVKCFQTTTLKEIYNPQLNTCYVDCASVSLATSEVFPGQRSYCKCQDPAMGWNQLTNKCDTRCPIWNSGEIVNQGCTCQTPDVYSYNYTSKTCQVDCSRIANTVPGIRKDTKTCICEPKYKWIIKLHVSRIGLNYTGVCVLDCKNLPHTTGYCSTLNMLNTTSCQCQCGYQWDSAAIQCVPKNSDTGTGITNNCQSGYNFVIDSSTGASSCVRSCSGPHIIGYDSSDANKCGCESGYEWSTASTSCVSKCQSGFNYVFDSNTGTSSCVKICSGAHITGCDSSDPNKCACQPGFSWNSNSQTCDTICQTGFNYVSDPTTGSSNCIRICSGAHITGLDSSDANKCTCQSGYQWISTSLTCEAKCQSGFNYITDPATGFSNCIRICSGTNVIGYDSSDANKCACESGYEWSTSSLACVSKCQTGFNYVKDPNTGVSQCVRICSGTNVIGYDSSDANKCACQSGYQWSSTSLTCVGRCQSGFNYVSDTVTGSSTCVRICSGTTNPYVVGSDPSDPNKCSCQLDFVWNTATVQCQRNCAPNSQDPYADKLNPSQTNQCLCLQNLIWSSSNGRCQMNCSYFADSNSTGFVNSTNLTQCVCRTNYTWDVTTSKCKVIVQPLPCYTCPTNFVYSAKDLGCVRNCSNNPYATGVNANNKSECDCMTSLLKSYTWSKTYRKCVPTCLWGMQWDDAEQKCVFKLFSADPTSSNDQSTVQQTSTQNSIQINQENNSNKQKAAIIGLGSLSGVLIVLVIGLIAYICKQRQDKKKVQQNQSDKSASQKQIVAEV